MGRTVYFELDPENPPAISAEEKARLDAMTDEEITAAALDDLDNPPLTPEELHHFRRIGWIRDVREKIGLSPEAFGERFGILPKTLAELERGREPDLAMVAFYRLIARDPNAAAAIVAEALAARQADIDHGSRELQSPIAAE